MAKHKSGGEAAEAGKRRPQKKVASRPGPRNRPSKPARAAKAKPGKPARSARPRREPGKPVEPTQVELPIDDIADALDLDLDVDAEDAQGIEDADILAETPAEAGSARFEARVAEQVIEVEDQPPTLSPEEQELSTLYGDDLAAPAIAHGEYADRQTADEDRPMVPEINARDERKAQWQERRDRRRRRRDERDRQRLERRGDHQQRHEPRPQEARPERTQHARIAAEPRQPYQPGGRPQGALAAAAPAAPAAAPTNGEPQDALARVGTPLGDAAAQVFAQLRNGQPLPVRQLAAMMRKRSLVETDPEQLWPQLKAELLGDERSYRTLGLRPRIVYRGRDLFAPGPVAMSQTADAEASVAAALSRLAGATHRALAARIARASAAGFERLIHAFLVAAGYREIAWVKRVGGISYASATAPGLDRTVLISARSGDQPVDRRGIGELRVGVEAKDLVAGILFSARELSEDAERELERAGRSISVICGDQLVAALIGAGVGVVSAAAPLHYVDDQLLDELLAG
ncbi:MAG: hypothetical protein E6J90_44215 [Deltaproteobacteria bacterium]|nr:MAG: hypothetical protein E6J90_44215 [Deltaproteobacteria bacterium]